MKWLIPGYRISFMSKKAKPAKPQRGRGRPKNPDGKPVTISANVSPALVTEIDAVGVEGVKLSRSQKITILVREALQARGRSVE